MKKSSSSMWTGLAVAATALAFYAGATYRDLRSVGAVKVASMEGNQLMASRDAQSVPEGDYFKEIAALLEREYVEPITDEQKLAVGGIRGMVGSLGDPRSVFMDKADFADYKRRIHGDYQGIGVELALVMPPGARTAAIVDAEEATTARMGSSPAIPRLTVVAVVPGGPADLAGVKLGDKVYEVDKHWVLNSDLIARFRQAQSEFEAKRIDIRALNKIRNEVRAKAERNLLPLKAKSKLVLGTSGPVEVVWERSGTKRVTRIERQSSKMPDTPNRIRFDATGVSSLIARARSAPSLTLDLRNNAVGDASSIKPMLEAVCSRQTFGHIAIARNGKKIPFSTSSGVSRRTKLTLLVDASTRGPAEIFALALSAQGLATLQGSATGGDRSIQDIVALPDGSGYTLVTGEFIPTPKVKR